MIDIRKLKELVRLMVSNELTELDLRDNEEQVTLRRNSPHHAPQVVAPPMHAPTAATSSSPGGATAVAEPPATSEQQEDDGLIRVESPMVGTFYSASDPDSTPFVSVGASVGPDDTVCMIEAMKIFNEIKAECSGTIRKVLVNNGEAVEFGQPLFLVEPA
jgi:acetyl-CoA carboxylase biotin carboxyl carrier protein